jgi:peptidoglycan/xylan/chitin deacetylase (PgdA/CDA1 family)
MHKLAICALAVSLVLVAGDARPQGAALPSCPGNPNALGVLRTVEIDTTGGPGFGFQHFKAYDFLRSKEVVLTFDDGPWPGNTPAVLAALAAECVKATFFAIGKHATWNPEILKQVAEQGHTIGSHTWSHKDLSKLPLDQAKDEIEKGVSAVHWALGGRAAPIFRFPALRHSPEAVSYLGERNTAIFSTDMDSFDFQMKVPEQIVQSVMTKLEKAGKGIVLLHDFQKPTAVAMPALLRELKAKGFQIVHVRTKAPATTLAVYDEAVAREARPTTANNAPPISTVVSTVAPAAVSSAPSAGLPVAAGVPQAIATPATAAQAISLRRVALVVGNSAYRAVPALPNPNSDAQAVAAALRDIGFQVVGLKTDLGKEALVTALRDFAREAEQADWAVVYFAGHGIELGASAGLGGANFLIPVDAKLETDRDIEFETVPLGHVITAVEGAKKLRLVILDACRDNPFARQMKRMAASRSVGRGLGRIEPDGGVLVAYAAKHGEVALDGGGRNSPFVAALVNRLPTPGVEIGKLFRLVRDDVLAATDRKQEPFVYGSLPGEDFFFVAGK